MQLCKAQLETGEIRVGVVSDDHVRFLDLQGYLGLGSLSDILHSDNPTTTARDLVDDRVRTESGAVLQGDAAPSGRAGRAGADSPRQPLECAGARAGPGTVAAAQAGGL